MIYFKNFDDVFTFNNLWKSYKRCLKGCRWKYRNQKFIENDLSNVNKLYNELHNGTYKLQPFNRFWIMPRGKLRHISSHTFRDRVVQKCLCDYYFVPLLSKSLIYDCGATLRKRGISFQRKRVIHHLNNYRMKYGSKGYVLTIDIHHYFECLDQEILLSKLRERVRDDRIFNLLTMIIHSKQDGGLCLGSQVSQICALYYVNEIDHFIKEKLHIKYYGRYMDDMYLISNDKKYLYKCFDRIVERLHKLNLMVNQKKSKVQYLENGFVFLKTKYKIKNNKIIRLIRPRAFKSMERKIAKGIDITNIVPCWLDYLSNFNCYHRYQKFKNKYGELYEE